MIFKEGTKIFLSIINEMPIVSDIVNFPSKLYRLFVDAQRKHHVHAVSQATVALATAKRQVKVNNLLAKNELEAAKQQVKEDKLASKNELEAAKQKVKEDKFLAKNELEAAKQKVKEDKFLAKNELEAAKQKVKEDKLLAKNEKEASAFARKQARDEGSAVKKALALKTRDFKTDNKKHQSPTIDTAASYDADYAVFVARRNLRLATSAHKALQYTHAIPVVYATPVYNRNVAVAAVEIP
jgi:hypothetical protein